ncbi:hypothetical protein IQ07DRAFT_65038 [Pyrenochaeta sp. DS3sAY3a]|nr:hypothetical protein IQ07DRAFT_65038 [Pyrenochaeta sp. DS3sAY3a]
MNANSARARYAHLYFPAITAFLILINGTIVAAFVNPTNQRPQDTLLLVAASALPTHLAASYFSPVAVNGPEAPRREHTRFTRKHDAYRALVLATYGRLFGTPFNPRFFILDFLLSYVAGAAIGERPEGTRQRRSEFFVALLWLAGSSVVTALVPPSMPTLTFWVTVADKMLWQSTYLALVDDVINVLARPNLRTYRGRATVILVQSFTITFLVYIVLSWIKRLSQP